MPAQFDENGYLTTEDLRAAWADIKVPELSDEDREFFARQQRICDRAQAERDAVWQGEPPGTEYPTV